MRPFVVPVLLLLSVSARGQLFPGVGGFMAYDIEFNGAVVGKVVVVAQGASPPAGYTSGKEYWSWTSGTPWRPAFKLVPAASVPSFGSYSWQTFPHDHFDLSGTVSIPTIDVGPNDAFWRVQVKSGASWSDRGWMWLVDGSPDAQVWYGKNLSTDLVGGDQIRFESVEPPDAGSVSVYELL